MIPREGKVGTARLNSFEKRIENKDTPDIVLV